MWRATSIAFVLLLSLRATAQAPAPTGAAPPAPAPGAPPPAGPPAPPPAAPTTPPPPVAPVAPPDGPAPPGYYGESPTEPPKPTGSAEPPRVYEPPPPGYGPIYEPPPPPVARHLAPNTALWVGLRVGWFVPFGYLYAENGANPYGPFRRVPWNDYAGHGIMFEGDVGARLGRNYTVFALWERAELASGDAFEDRFGGQNGGDSDFWAIGLSATSNADSLGFLTEIALGYRQFRATWEDGTERQFTDGWLEGRIGFGADIRFSPMLSIQPMLTLGVGAFGDVEHVFPDGSSANLLRPGDTADSHSWFTLGIGGHVDLFGKK